MREWTGPPRGMCAEPRLDRPLEPSQQLCSPEGPPGQALPGCFHAVCLWPEDTARLGEGGRCPDTSLKATLWMKAHYSLGLSCR